jgi:acyl-coenzyme A thioesterase PaaI-like protein
MFEIENPLVVQKVAKMMKQNYFMHFIGFEITKVASGAVEGQLIMQDHHRQQNGYAHGGIMTTLCDTVAGFAAFTLIDPSTTCGYCRNKSSLLPSRQIRYFVG